MIIVVDGPPASGKSTVVKYLRLKRGFSAYRYKRLGLVNIFSIMLLPVNPWDKKVKYYIHSRVDPIILVSSGYLERLSGLLSGLEVVYKCIRYASLFLLALVCRNIVIDEGISLGWANYFNLVLFKRALKREHVDFLMRIDLASLRVLSKVHEVYYYFIDRSLEKLESNWRKRGHKTPYDVKFYLLVRYAFKLFMETVRERSINIRVKYVYAS